MRKDADIKTDVVDEIAWDPVVDETRIGVSVVDGAVTLTGSVTSYAERRAAERAALRVRGVKSVAEDIRVAPARGSVADDSDLAKRIAHLLEWDAVIPHERIQAEVRDGAVTLTGEVDWRHQSDLVAEHVGRLRGVRSIDNRLRVSRHPAATNVREEITRALHRHADIEANNVTVEVDGGKVRLTGAVRAPYERALIESAAWSAPGVTEVVDELALR